jgi:UDP-N-acetylmuramoyl-tripeptide--D-alanyl-D-alanine ligase
MCDGSIVGDKDIIIDAIVIDSRKAQLGKIFIAIMGEVNDGHDFIVDALKNGTNTIIVEEKYTDFAPGITYIIVKNTTKALGDIAHHYRMMFSIPVIGITGSNGKTTVKEMLKSICTVKYGESCVLASKDSLNNHWGVPLTLLELKKEHKVAIIEMGMNHFGELTYLSNLAVPTIAVINNVSTAHIGNFSCIDDIAKAKGEIYSGIFENGVALINANSKYSKYWSSLIKNPKINIEYFANHESKCYIKSIDNNVSLLNINDDEVEIKLNVLGEHNHQNALTAIAISSLMNIEINSIVSGLSNYYGYKSRLEIKKGFNGITIVDDSYNANPDSVKSAILAIKNLPKPHWFILGSLNELGVFSVDKHHEIGLFAKENEIDKLITIGHDTIYAIQSFGVNALYFDSKEKIIDYCKSNLPSNGVLLIKASNSLKLWEIANALELINN